MNWAPGALALLIIACSSSSLSCHAGPDATHVGGAGDGGDDAAQGDGASACGTPNASSQCESVTWPRMVVAFGDSSAAGFSYVFRADDGIASSDRNPCPAGYGESTALHCDIGFYGNPNEKMVSVSISAAEGGAVFLSRDIPLTPFNYCGIGIAQVVATTSDAGIPQLSPVNYVDACGSL